MARIRTIKPSFFRSDDVSALPLRARLTWIGLWTQCDDQGRAKDHARLIKADIWPLDPVSLADIEEDLETLAGHGRIVRYEVDGQRYLEITNWRAHQAIQKPTASRIPPPDKATVNGSATPTVVLPEDADTAIAGKGRERKGREGTRVPAREPDPPTPNPASPEPPPRCEKHLDNPDPSPCGACAEARKTLARWQVAKAARIAKAPKCRVHRGQPAGNCGLCRAEELSPA
jgi:hypothetical protein